MGKVFNYIRTGETYFDAVTDEYVEQGIDFQYEVSWADVKDALVNIIFNRFFRPLPEMMDKKENIKNCKGAIIKFISDTDIEETLVETMEEDLKEYFEPDAFESLKD